MKNTKIILFLVFSLALILRISFIVFYENGKMLKNLNYAADEYSYDQIAINFLSGKGFVTDDGLYSRRAPVYPLFLAFIYLIFGHSYVIVRFIQAIIGSLTCLIIYLLGKELFDKKIGLLSAFIFAIYYPFIQYPAYLLTEIIFTFLLVVSMFFFLRYYFVRKNSLLFSATIFLGIASLCRASSLLFILFLSFWLGLLYRFKLRQTIKAVFVLLSGIIIIVLPWTIRNYIIYKRVVPITIESGIVLYLGNNPRATGGTGGWTKYEQDQFLPENISNPYTPEAERTMLRLALRYIFNHPKRTIMLGFKKFINLWRPFYADARLINKIIMSIFYIPIIVLATLGIIKTACENFKRYNLFYFLILYFILMHMITISNIRYRDPAMPFLIIFSSFGFMYIKNKILKAT